PVTGGWAATRTPGSPPRPSGTARWRKRRPRRWPGEPAAAGAASASGATPLQVRGGGKSRRSGRILFGARGAVEIGARHGNRWTRASSAAPDRTADLRGEQASGPGALAGAQRPDPEGRGQGARRRERRARGGRRPARARAAAVPGAAGAPADRAAGAAAGGRPRRGGRPGKPGLFQPGALVSWVVDSTVAETGPSGGVSAGAVPRPAARHRLRRPVPRSRNPHRISDSGHWIVDGEPGGSPRR